MCQPDHPILASASPKAHSPMPGSPSLVLVDLRTQRRDARRARLISAVVGVAIATASAVPFLLGLLR